MKSLWLALAGLAVVLGSAAHAQTVVSVTQVRYDLDGRPMCTAVRMNPAAYGSLPSDACALGSQGSYGPDRITYNQYDSDGRVTEIDQAYGVSGTQRAYARYYYNPNGTKLYEVDANNNTTQYAYDGFDRLQRIYYPCPSTQYCANGNDYEQFAYDADNNKTSWQRRNGKTISYTYDALNREITRSVSDGSVQTVYSGYDLQGHALYARYGSTTGAGITNTYDGLGRLGSTIDMNGRQIWLGYNQASAPIYLAYPDGSYTADNVDAENRQTSKYLNSSLFLTAQGYDNLGRRYWLNQGAQPATQTGYGYDNLGRLTSLAQYLNGSNGSGSNVSWSFAYSPANQIVSTSASSTLYDYKETSATAATVNNTYDDLNRDAAIAAITGGYDADGNLTNDGTRLFYYDVYNRLTGVGSSAYPQNGPYLTLAYDPLGRLASQTYYGTTTSFLYDGTELIGEYNGSGTMTERYIQGDGVDEPLVWFHGAGNVSSPYYFVQDYHGSVIGYTDAAGNLQTVYKYGPYGEPKDVGNATDFAGARFRYTGQTVIPEVGLYYYRARVYDPIFGRFLQTDPIGSKDDLDLYAYTAGDPINAIDPTGDDQQPTDQGLSEFWNSGASDSGGGDGGGSGSGGSRSNNGNGGQPVPPDQTSPNPKNNKTAPVNIGEKPDTEVHSTPGTTAGASDKAEGIGGVFSVFNDMLNSMNFTSEGNGPIQDDELSFKNSDYNHVVVYGAYDGGTSIGAQYNDANKTEFIKFPTRNGDGFSTIILYKMVTINNNVLWTTNDKQYHVYSTNPPSIGKYIWGFQ